MDRLKTFCAMYSLTMQWILLTAHEARGWGDHGHDASKAAPNPSRVGDPSEDYHSCSFCRIAFCRFVHH